MSWEIRQGDALEVLRGMEAGSVQTCVTSPPYWGLRDYGTAEWEGGDSECDHREETLVSDDPTSTLGIDASGKNRHGANNATVTSKRVYKDTCGKCGAKRIDSQLGLEPTPEQYVENLVAVFREVRRVLRDDGTVWLNLGDSYASSPPGNKDTNSSGLHGAQTSERYAKRLLEKDARASRPRPKGIKPKDLVGIPWRTAFALQADGWWLRSDIIWAKPNPMPESVTDRPTRAHEYVFLLTKSARYFYDADAIREDGKDWSSGGPGVGIKRTFHYGAENGGNEGLSDLAARYKTGAQAAGRNKRSVWTVTTQPFSWRQNARRVRVAPDEVSGDTMRSTSPSCPIHGGRPVRASTAGDGGHEADDPSRSERSDARLDQAPLDELAPTDPRREPNSDDGSSDSPRPADSRTATAHSTGTRKTASGSTSGDTASEETSARTVGMSPSNETPGQGGSDSRDSSQTPDRTAHKPACTCEYYRLEETDHFATFPPKLVEPCILAGSPPKCCGECGAPWERVRERQDLRHWTERRTDRKKWDYGQGHGRNDGGGSFEGDDGITLGWRPSCDCLLKCPNCGVEFKHDGRYEEVRDVRSEVHSPALEEEKVLQPDMREPIPLAAQEDGEREIHDQQGLRLDSSDEPSERVEGRLRDGTSAGDGANAGPGDSAERGSASPEWGQVGQPPGKPAGDAEADTRRAPETASASSDGPMSLLRRDSSADGTCPSCGSTPEQARSVVLDIFCGSGTTGVVALRHNRSFIGIELNPDYCEMARNRIRDDAPLMNTISEAV